MGELTSNNWHVGVKLFIALLIIGLGVICVIVKVTFVVWLYRLEKKLKDYLQSLDSELENPDHTTLQVKLLSLPFMYAHSKMEALGCFSTFVASSPGSTHTLKSWVEPGNEASTFGCSKLHLSKA